MQAPPTLKGIQACVWDGSATGWNSNHFVGFAVLDAAGCLFGHWNGFHIKEMWEHEDFIGI